MAGIRPLILFTEANDDDLELDKDHYTDAKNTADAEIASSKKPADSEDDNTDDLSINDPSDNDGSDDDMSNDGSDDDTDDDNTDGDNTDDPNAGSEQAPPDYSDIAKKEKLFDSIVNIRNQCRSLLPAAEYLSTAIKDDKALGIVIKIKKSLQDTLDQVNLISIKFNDIGYDKVSTLYPILFDRISMVTDLLSNVIDNDERFKSDKND